MEAKAVVDFDAGKFKISKHVYGHFAEHLGRCIYGGFWTGENSKIPNRNGIRTDVVEALKKLKIPNLRWPGGCFADEYHWEDGVGPREKRPSMINTHWGGVSESNHFGTHEFLELCEQLGCEPCICGNVGSGTVREMSQWVEYLNSDGESPMTKRRAENGREKPWNVRLWDVGNENWGCGGNMRPEHYADLFRNYATYCRNYGDKKLFKIACGPNGEDWSWTETLMRQAGRFMDALSLHYYTWTGDDHGHKRTAADFDEARWNSSLRNAAKMDRIIARHSAIMDAHDPERRIALAVDEWGTWHEVEPGTNPGFLHQQSSMRDALVAGLTLNIFNKHCERVRLANIAQTVNVLQAMILTEGDKTVLTPSYHVFEMYKGHQDALMFPANVLASPSIAEGVQQLSASASRSDDGKTLLTLCNLSYSQSLDVVCALRGAPAFKSVKARILEAERKQEVNSFERPDAVAPKAFDDVKLQGSDLKLSLPSGSVVAIELE